VYVSDEQLWRRFQDTATVQVLPFALLRHDQSAKIPDRVLAPILRASAKAEELLPAVVVRVAAYSLIVLTNR